MEKALRLLKTLRDDYIHGELNDELNEAITELEEAIKPKSCDDCRSKLCSVRRILVEAGEINSSYFYCNDHEPKVNA